jgi:citrate synthase
MREGVIFEITKKHLQEGLRDIPVGYCSTSYVDPQKGVFYVGKSLFELVLRDPLEVIYLLLHGRESTESELRFFAEEIEKRAVLSEEFVQEVKKFSTKVDPLLFFSMALQLLGSLESKKDPKEDCQNIIAKLPSLVALVMHLYEGGEKFLSAQEDLGIFENFIEHLPISSKQKENFSASTNSFF